MNKTYCDKCGVEIPEPEHSIYPSGGSWSITGYYVTIKPNRPRELTKTDDLCYSCGNKLKRFYDSLMESENDE